MLSVIFIKEVMDMSTQSDFLDAMEILIKERAKPGTLIYTGKVNSVNDVSCEVLVNGQVKQMPWFGNVKPVVNNTYKIYVPQGEFSSAYLLNVESLVNNIVEEGQTGSWKWRKWKNGTAECWGQFLSSGSINTGWGSLYHGCPSNASLSYPTGIFDEVPSEIVTAYIEGQSDAIILATVEQNTKTQAGRYMAVRPESLSNVTVVYNYYVHS